MIATFACFWTLPLITSRWLSFIASAVLSLGRSRTMPNTVVSEVSCGLAHHVGKRWFEAALFPNTLVSEVFCWLAHHVGKRWLSFIARAVLSIRRSRTYCQTHWLQMIFVGWLIMLGRGGSLSLQELCFQVGRSRTIAKHTGFRGFCGLLIMLGRGGSLSLQELCFQYVEAALLPNTLVQMFFCGLAHHVGNRWLTLFHSLMDSDGLPFNFLFFLHRDLMVYLWCSNLFP